MDSESKGIDFVMWMDSKGNVFNINASGDKVDSFYDFGLSWIMDESGSKMKEE